LIWFSARVFSIEINMERYLQINCLSFSWSQNLTPRHSCLYHDWLIKRSSHVWKDWDRPSSLASNFRLEVAFQFYSVQWFFQSAMFLASALKRGRHPLKTYWNLISQGGECLSLGHLLRHGRQICAVKTTLRFSRRSQTSVCKYSVVLLCYHIYHLCFCCNLTNLMSWWWYWNWRNWNIIHSVLSFLNFTSWCHFWIMFYLVFSFYLRN
jgi:hypothetical protein